MRKFHSRFRRKNLILYFLWNLLITYVCDIVPKKKYELFIIQWTIGGVGNNGHSNNIMHYEVDEFTSSLHVIHNTEHPGFWTKTSMIQLGYGVWAGMIIIGVGMAFGFSAVTLPALKGDDTIETPTESESAWIGK